MLIASALVLGGGALAIAICDAVPVPRAVAIRPVFGALFGAFVTPLALRPLLKSESVA